MLWAVSANTTWLGLILAGISQNLLAVVYSALRYRQNDTGVEQMRLATP